MNSNQFSKKTDGLLWTYFMIQFQTCTLQKLIGVFGVVSQVHYVHKSQEKCNSTFKVVNLLNHNHLLYHHLVASGNQWGSNESNVGGPVYFHQVLIGSAILQMKIKYLSVRKIGSIITPVFHALVNEQMSFPYVQVLCFPSLCPRTNSVGCTYRSLLL